MDYLIAGVNGMIYGLGLAVLMFVVAYFAFHIVSLVLGTLSEDK